MRPIRRAAVSGLMALWLAPLPALAGGEVRAEGEDGRRAWAEERPAEDGAARREALSLDRG